MTVTESDIQLAYDEAMKDPIKAMRIRSEKEARRHYEGLAYYLDDCGESKAICRRCANYSECLKRVD